MSKGRRKTENHAAIEFDGRQIIIERIQAFDQYLAMGWYIDDYGNEVPVMFNPTTNEIAPESAQDLEFFLM